MNRGDWFIIIVRGLCATLLWGACYLIKLSVLFLMALHSTFFLFFDIFQVPGVSTPHFHFSNNGSQKINIDSPWLFIFNFNRGESKSMGESSNYTIEWRRLVLFIFFIFSFKFIHKEPKITWILLSWLVWLSTLLISTFEKKKSHKSHRMNQSKEKPLYCLYKKRETISKGLSLEPFKIAIGRSNISRNKISNTMLNKTELLLGPIEERLIIARKKKFSPLYKELCRL